MNFKKTFILLACSFTVTAFAQNTRTTLLKSVSKVYSDIERDCNKGMIDQLDAKYKKTAEKSPNKTLTKTDEEKYLTQFRVLQSSFSECKRKNQSQKIEKLQALIAQVEEENKTAFISKNTNNSATAQKFSYEIVRNQLTKLLSGNDLFSYLEETLRLRLTFVLDTDGVMKNVKISGTNNEEIKLICALDFYSITEVFLPEEENGKPVKKLYTLPLTFMVE